jgi:hypothetical protein
MIDKFSFFFKTKCIKQTSNDEIYLNNQFHSNIALIACIKANSGNIFQSRPLTTTPEQAFNYNGSTATLITS